MSGLASLFQDVYNAAEGDDKKQRVRRLWDMAVGSVHLVDRGANKRRFLIRKSEDGDDLFGDVMLEDDEGLTFFDTDEPADTEKAVWTTAYVNDLPDTAFLFIESGGEKDADGKTTPRSLRHFPVYDADGKLDAPHTRNAIARIPQSNAPGLSADMKRQLQEKARKLLAEITKSAPDVAADTLADITEKALALMKSAQSGTIDSEDFAAEAEALGLLLASISPSPTKEEAVKTNEIDTIKMAIAQAKSPQTCAYCDEPAAYGLVYNEGKEFIPCCGGHVMQATNDLAKKDMKVEEKLTMPSKGDGKKADAKKADAEGDLEDDAAKKKCKTKKSDTSIAATIAKHVDEVAIEIEKAGRKMSKERVGKLKAALMKLLELAKELDPSETQDILNASISKRLDGVECEADGTTTDTKKSAEPEKIGDGKSTSDSPTDVSKSDDEDGPVMWGVNLNDPSLHRGTVDKETSFFE